MTHPQTNTTLIQVVERILIAIAVAATIGGGSAVLTNWNTNSLQDQQLSMISLKLAATDALLEELETTHRQLAVLNERITWLINK